MPVPPPQARGKPRVAQVPSNSQRQLRRSDQHQRLLLDNADQGIVVVADGLVRYHNPAATELFGYRAGDGLGQLALEFLHPDDAPWVNQLVSGLREPGNAVVLETRLIRRETVRVPGGTPALCWARISVVRSEWDGASALIMYITDLTRLRQLNQALEDALKQKEAILKHAAMGVCMATQCTVQWINDTLAGWLGHSPGALTGMPLEALYGNGPVLDQALAALDQVRDDGAPARIECALPRHDGSTLWVQVEGHRLHASGDAPELNFWTFVDISLRRQAELDIRQALERERELGALKTNFVSMASHEFRTPLTTIQTASDLLLHYGTRLTPNERDDSLRDIQNAVLQMRALMEDVLVLARMDAPVTPTAPVPWRVPELLAQLVTEARRVDQGQHNIELQHPTDPCAEVALLDEARLRKILGNLISNACKYSPPTSTVQVEWRRTVRYLQRGPGDTALEMAELEIEVRDQGIGIPQQDQARLFQSFHRASNVGEVEGTGLGLPIVKRAIDSLDGAITVHSVEGQGTVFRVQLPWRDAPAT